MNRLRTLHSFQLLPIRRPLSGAKIPITSVSSGCSSSPLHRAFKIARYVARLGCLSSATIRAGGPSRPLSLSGKAIRKFSFVLSRSSPIRLSAITISFTKRALFDSVCSAKGTYGTYGVIRWGILSTARIGEEFLKAVRSGQASEIRGVASRDEARAAAWAGRWGVEKAFGSYEALLASDEIDAVYVALPNSMHPVWTIRALTTGKHVLCEKPMALNAAEIDAIHEAADRAGRLVMEGFMFMHHPLTRRVSEMVAAAALGDIVTVRSWHGFTVENVATDIRYKPELGGGVLADLGCYCVAGTLNVVPGQVTSCSKGSLLDSGGRRIDLRDAWLRGRRRGDGRLQYANSRERGSAHRRHGCTNRDPTALVSSPRASFLASDSVRRPSVG